MGPYPELSYVMSPAHIFGVYEHMHDIGNTSIELITFSTITN